MKNTFLYMIGCMLCACNLCAQSVFQTVPLPPDGYFEKIGNDVPRYCVIVDDYLIMMKRDRLILAPNVPGMVNVSRDASARWIIVKSEEGLSLLNEGANRNLGARITQSVINNVPGYNTGFTTRTPASSSRIIRSISEGSSAIPVPGTFPLTKLEKFSETGICVKLEGGTFYLVVQDNYIKWTKKFDKSHKVEIVSLDQMREKEQFDFDFAKAVAGRKVVEPITLKQAKLNQEQKEKVAKLKEPDPEGALSKIHETIARVESQYRKYISKDANGCTVTFNYLQPGSDMPHFPFNFFASSLAYGSPTEGYPNSPSYSSKVTFSKTAITFHLSDKNVMISGDLDSKGNDVKPSDPFTEAWGCKGGNSKIKKATLVLPGNKMINIDGTINCSHSHRAISRSGSSSYQFNTVVNPLGRKIKVAGMTDYYPGHCFNHTQTTTYNMSDIVSSSGMDIEQLTNLMMQGGGILLGQTNNDAAFVSDNRARECMTWALWNAFGFTDEKFINTYVNMNETDNLVYDKGQQIKDNLRAFAYRPTDEPEKSEFDSLIVAANQHIKSMSETGIPYYSFAHDMASIMYRYGEWKYGRYFAILSNEELKARFSPKYSGQGYSDWSGFAKKTYCSNLWRICKCEIMSEALNLNLLRDKTSYYGSGHDGETMWRRLYDRLPRLDDPRDELLYCCHAYDCAGTFSLFVERNPYNACKNLLQMMLRVELYNDDAEEKVGEDKLETFITYRVLRDAYPVLYKDVFLPELQEELRNARAMRAMNRQ